MKKLSNLVKICLLSLALVLTAAGMAPVQAQVEICEGWGLSCFILGGHVFYNWASPE